MYIYNTKFLIQGHKVAREFAGKVLVAVPKKKLGKNDIEIVYHGEVMKLEMGTVPLIEMPFPDKYGREPYFMSYFEWCPEE